MVCYIRKYVIILGDIPVDVPPTKILGGCVPGIPGGVDASGATTYVGEIKLYILLSVGLHTNCG